VATRGNFHAHATKYDDRTGHSKKKRSMRAVLDEKDFETLISGGEVNHPRLNLQITLNEIGYQRMFEILQQVVEKSNKET